MKNIHFPAGSVRIPTLTDTCLQKQPQYAAVCVSFCPSNCLCTVADWRPRLQLGSILTVQQSTEVTKLTPSESALCFKGRATNLTLCRGGVGGLCILGQCDTVCRLSLYLFRGVYIDKK